MRFALFVALLAACAAEPDEAPGVVVTHHELPELAPVPAANTDIAHPISYVPDGRPTLLLFSASWCPSCSASLLVDVALIEAFSDRAQVGIGLVENSDEDFVRWPMARLLARVPVWNAASVRELAVRCGAATLPLACLVDHGRVLWRGSSVAAAPMVEARAANRFERELVERSAARAAATLQLASGLDEDDILQIARSTRRDPDWQLAIVEQLLSRRDTSTTDAALAVALAHEIVASDGGLDLAHLDTYSLALSKANLPDQAAAASWRVLELCSVVHADCIVEKRRAYAYIYYARERGKPRRR